METGKTWELAWTDDRWTLKLGDKGLTVALWQKFLMDSGLMGRPKYEFDDKSIGSFIGVFESATLSATKKYQKSKALNDDGVVGFDTYSKASEEGFDGIAMEMAIAFALNRMNHNPEANSSFEVVFSSKKISPLKRYIIFPKFSISQGNRVQMRRYANLEILSSVNCKPFGKFIYIKVS